MTLPQCSFRGRILRDRQICFCKHPSMNERGVKSTSVPFAVCLHCPVPLSALVPPRPKKLGVGSELKRIWAERFPYLEGCGGCNQLASNMDEWGPEECRNRLDDITSQVLERARTLLKKGLVASLPDVMLRTAIKRDIKKAIRVVEEHESRLRVPAR